METERDWEWEQGGWGNGGKDIGGEDRGRLLTGYKINRCIKIKNKQTDCITSLQTCAGSSNLASKLI